MYAHTHAVHARRAPHHCHIAYSTRQMSHSLHMCRLLCQSSECECNSVRGVRSWCNLDLGRPTRIWRYYWALVQNSLVQLQLQLQLPLCHHCEQCISMGKTLLRPPTTVPQWEWTLSILGTPITAMMCVSTQEAVRVSAQWGTAHSPQLVDCLRVVECYLIAHVHACYVDSCSVSYFRKLGCTDAEWFQLF